MKIVKLISVFCEGSSFLGNIAAVIELEKAIETKEMQAIARDLNQPATTFIIPEKNGEKYIRWFAPDAEIPLCGHGLAAAVAYYIELGQKMVSFNYSKGKVSGKSFRDGFEINIKKGSYLKEETPNGLEEYLGADIIEHYSSTDKNIVLLKDEKTLKELKPNFSALAKLKPFGYAVTAPSDHVDFVSRTLVPKVQQLEDHATGSSHTVLVPFWAEKLGKNQLKTYQLSPRGGAFNCLVNDNEVILRGNYKEIVIGTII